MTDEAQKDEEPVIVRCIICNTPYTAKQIDAQTSCLKCGTKATPMPVVHDLKNVSVNWLELMILVEWSEHFAHVLAQQERSDTGIKIIAAIATRLMAYRPEGTKALLLGQRMLEEGVGGGRIIVPPPGTGGRLKDIN